MHRTPSSRRSLMAFSATVVALSTLSGCMTDQTRAPAPVVLRPEHRNFNDAGQVFATRGPQPGQRLQAAWVMGLDGQSVDLRGVGDGRPLVIVTASISSSVARRSQPSLELLQARYGDSVRFVTLYTVEAHPSHDLSPYSGTEWVTADNVVDDVLVRQPTVMLERMELARRYQQMLEVRTLLLVDPMDNVGWRTLGMGPNLAVVADANGVVVQRQGWLDPTELQRTLDGMTGGATAGATGGATGETTSPTTGGAPGDPIDQTPVVTLDLPPGLAPELAADLVR